MYSMIHNLFWLEDLLQLFHLWWTLQNRFHWFWSLVLLEKTYMKCIVNPPLISQFGKILDLSCV